MLKNGIAPALAACGLMALASACLADGPCGAAPCGDGGCAKTVCRPVTEVKKLAKPAYDDICEPICVTRPLGYLLHRKCEYTRIITKKTLIRRVYRSEECIERCVPVVEAVAPACSAPCAGKCEKPCEAPCGTPAIIMTVPSTGPVMAPMPLPPTSYTPAKTLPLGK